MSDAMREVVAYATVPLTLVALVFTVRTVRRTARIRLGFDIARSAISIAAIVAVATITGVTTRSELLVIAVIGGGALGVAQGAALRVEPGPRGPVARRAGIAIALWGIGIAVMQAGGAAQRAGALQLGQTLAVFSAAMGVGILFGRMGPMDRARQQARTSAPGTVAAAPVVAVVVAVAVIGIAALWARPSDAAPSGDLTSEQLCELLVQAGANSPDADVYNGIADRLRVLEEGFGVSSCQEVFTLPYTGQPGFVYLQLLESEAAAQSMYARYVAGIDAWLAGSPSDCASDVALGDEGHAGCLDGADAFAVVRVGRFLVIGYSDNLGPEGIVLPIDILLERMGKTVAVVESLGTTTPPATTTPPTTAPATTVPPPETTAAAVPTVPPQTVAPVAPTVPPTIVEPPTSPAITEPTTASVTDEEITPQEAAASAVTGLIAAAAIGLVTWAEAAARIAERLGSGGGAGGGAGGGRTPQGPQGAEPPNEFAPRPQTPVLVDGDGRPVIRHDGSYVGGRIGQVWDPDAGEWVDDHVLADRIRARHADDTARDAARRAAHDAQADRDWADLQRRSREAAASEQRRQNADRRRREQMQRVTDRIRDLAEGTDFDGLVEHIDRNPVPTEAELAALRDAIARHIGQTEAIAGLPTEAELYSDALRQTRDTIASGLERGGQPGTAWVLRDPEAAARTAAAIGTGGWSEALWAPFDMQRDLAAAEAAAGRSLTDEELWTQFGTTWAKAAGREILGEGIARGVGAMQRGTGPAAEALEQTTARVRSRGTGRLGPRASGALDEAAGATRPQTRPPTSPADELVVERIEPARFPRRPPPVIDPEPPPTPPPPRTAPTGIDAGIELGDVPAGTTPGFGPEFPDIPPRVPIGPEDIEMRVPGIDDLDTLPRTPDLIDDLDIDLGVSPPRTPTTPAAPVGSTLDDAADAATTGAPRPTTADEIVIERANAGADRPIPHGWYDPESEMLREFPDDVPTPPTRPPAGAADELVVERIEPARFPRRPPPVIDPEPPPTPPPPRTAPTGIDDVGINPTEAQPDAIPGFGPEFPDIPPRVPIGPEDIEMRVPGIDDLDTLPRTPDLIDDLDIDLGVGPPRTPTPTTPPSAPTTPVGSTLDDLDDLAPAPAPAPAPARPPDQDLADAVLRGDDQLPRGVSDDLEIRGPEQFSGAQHAGQGGWSPEALAREESYWRSNATLKPGADAVDALPTRGDFDIQYNPRTRNATVRFGEGLTAAQKRQLLRPGGPVEQTVARIRQILEEPPT